MIRSGKYGEWEEQALRENLAILGWNELGDLSQIEDRQRLAATLEAAYPHESRKTLANWESQLWPFLRKIAKSDLVVMPLKSRSAIAIGRMNGPYRFRSSESGGRHVREVDWIKEVPRSAFQQDLLYSFGAFMTVCQIRRNDAESRVEALLAGEKDSNPAETRQAFPGRPKKADETRETDRSTDDTSDIFSIAEAADDRIREQIGTVFKGHRLARLIGAVLEAQGYRAVVSPPGADGGIDIVAGKGSLGFDEPRLVVQVKSQESAVDVSVLRELQGVMHQFGAQQGLLVAWGGITKALRREAQRLFFKIRIWDAGDVLKAVQQAYENLPEEFQADLPLKRIWVLADTE
jgi:restriction system protein